MKKRKAGRPRKPSGTAKTDTITVKLSADDKAKVDKAVKVSGLGRSTWARKCLLYVAEKNISVT
jgi:hypothetical protein